MFSSDTPVSFKIMTPIWWEGGAHKEWVPSGKMGSYWKLGRINLHYPAAVFRFLLAFCMNAQSQGLSGSFGYAARTPVGIKCGTNANSSRDRQVVNCQQTI